MDYAEIWKLNMFAEYSPEEQLVMKTHGICVTFKQTLQFTVKLTVNSH